MIIMRTRIEEQTDRAVFGNAKSIPRKLFLAVFLFELFNSILLQNGLARVIGDLFVFGIAPLAFAILIRSRYVETWNGILKEFRVSWVGVAYSAVLAVVAVGVFSRGVVVLEKALPVARQSALLTHDAIEQCVRQLPSWHCADLWIPIAVYAAATAAIVEEFVFKVLLFRARNKWGGEMTFVACSALTFSIIHLEQGLAAMIMIGVVFGVPTSMYYWRSKEVGNLVLFHFFSDLIFFGLQ